MFAWLETTEVALWVSLSLWAYPMLLGAHIIGLAVVVGIFVVRDLRLLGMFPGLDPAAFLTIGKLAWAGFVLNALSGVLLFTSQAVTFAANPAFLVKITSIIAGMVTAGIIQARLRADLAGSVGAGTASRQTRLVAAISLSLWIVAIITGRLVAYL